VACGSQLRRSAVSRQGVKMKLAVVGASGQIGWLLVPDLVARGHQVVAVARRWAGEPFGPAVEYRVADVMEVEQLDRTLAAA